MTEQPVQSFWDYSLAVYSRPGVAKACLAAQDETGCDVNLALYCLYAGDVLGRALSPEDMAQLVAALEPWNRLAVRPLRALRRALKPAADDPAVAALRHQIGAAELAAERIAQERLAAALPAVTVTGPSRALARANLERYAGSAAAPLLAALG